MTRVERLEAKRTRKISRRRRPSASGAISILALVVAMSGGAYAASSLITTNQIQDGTIKLTDINPQALAKIKVPGPPGAPGVNGVNGANGFNGQNGSSGVLGTATVDHIINGTTLIPLSYIYLGTPNLVNVNTGQRVTGSVSAALGSAGGATATLALCYSQGGVLTNFQGASFFGQSVVIDATRRNYTASQSVANLAAGTYIVGFCGAGTGTVDNNSSATGWFQVTS